MSNYHITQEQLRKLATEIDVAGANVTVFENGDIGVFGTKGLLQIVNSALDKVLGEPVGETQHLHELNDEWVSKLSVGTKLYAPKEQS